MDNNSRKEKQQKLRNEILDLKEDIKVLINLKRELILDLKELSYAYTGNGWEREVVRVEEIRPYLEAWIKQYNSINGRGAINYINEMANIPGRTTRRIRAGSQKVLTLSKADQLLTAIGKGDLLGREIKVIPNPNLSINKNKNGFNK